MKHPSSSLSGRLAQTDTFLLILIFLMISTMLAIDIYTPSLPSIQAYFQTGEDKVRITVAMLSVGSCLSIPIYGPLSDAWGRRPILLAGQLIYLGGLVLAVVASSIEGMILARFIQGLGSSASGCVGFALASDLTQGSKRIAYFSYLSATITLCLVIGPLIGGVFESHNNWKGSFQLLILLTCLSIFSLLWLPESVQKRKKVEIISSLKAYAHMIKTPQFLGSSLMPPLMISGLVAYVVNGVFYFVHELHMTPNEFSYHQAFVMFVNTFGGILAGSIVRSYGPSLMLKVGMLFLALGAGSLCSCVLLGYASPWVITGTMAVYAFGLGGTFGIFVNAAISLFPEKSGAVSSLLSVIRSLVISVAIMVSNSLYDKTIGSVAWMVVVAALGGLVGSSFLKRRGTFSKVKSV